MPNIAREHNKQISMKLTDNSLVEDIAVKFGKFVCANMEVEVNEEFIRNVYTESFKPKYRESLNK